MVRKGNIFVRRERASYTTKTNESMCTLRVEGMERRRRRKKEEERPSEACSSEARVSVTEAKERIIIHL